MLVLPFYYDDRDTATEWPQQLPLWTRRALRSLVRRCSTPKMAAPPPMKMLSLDEARTALHEALSEFDKPEHKSRMETAIAEGLCPNYPGVCSGSPVDRLVLVFSLQLLVIQTS